MSQPVPTSTQAGWGGDSADTGMSAADKARDWGEQEAAIQPRIIDPAGQAPKALAAVPEAQQAGGAEAAAERFTPRRRSSLWSRSLLPPGPPVRVVSPRAPSTCTSR